MKAKHVKFDVQLSGWSFNARNEIYEAFEKVSLLFEKAVAKGAEEVLNIALKDKSYIHLAADAITSNGIGGEAPDDPLTILLFVPLFNDNDECPAFEFHLSDAVEDAIDDNVEHESGKIENKKAIGVFLRMSSSLRNLADKIDDSLAIGGCHERP